MAKINPRRIVGKWRDGYALDLHTLSSSYIGDNEFGHPQFETTRSEIGELLYRLKYDHDAKVVDEIVKAARQFLVSKSVVFDIIVPVPPSTQRKVQPLMLLSEELSRQVRRPLANCVKHTREASPLKNVHGFDERMELLDGLYAVDAKAIEGKRVLLIDDLYRSGATMNAIAELLDRRGAKDIFALAITRTRSNR